jgi:hypothetical protein
MRMMNVITRERRDETRAGQERRLSQRWGGGYRQPGAVILGALAAGAVFIAWG